MELGAHNVMRMASYYINTISALVVPNSHGLVIGGRKYPGQFVMEICGPHIIDVAFKGKQAPFLFIIPDSHIATIGAGYE